MCDDESHRVKSVPIAWLSECAKMYNRLQVACCVLLWRGEVTFCVELVYVHRAAALICWAVQFSALCRVHGMQ